MDLAKLEGLFSITAWRSADGWTVGVQRHAGDQVRYATRARLEEALGALVPCELPPLPYGAR